MGRRRAARAAARIPDQVHLFEFREGFERDVCMALIQALVNEAENHSVRVLPDLSKAMRTVACN